MADQPDKSTQTPELRRFEEVLLCAPGGGQAVTFIHTLKWMETVRVFKKNDLGEETDEALGFLVTVPPRNALRVYSHVCRDVKSHTRAVASLEKDIAIKDRTRSNLPAVWNGDYQDCPLCALDLIRKESNEDHSNVIGKSNTSNGPKADPRFGPASACNSLQNRSASHIDLKE